MPIRLEKHTESVTSGCSVNIFDPRFGHLGIKIFNCRHIIDTFHDRIWSVNNTIGPFRNFLSNLKFPCFQSGISKLIAKEPNTRSHDTRDSCSFNHSEFPFPLQKEKGPVCISIQSPSNYIFLLRVVNREILFSVDIIRTTANI